MAKVLISHSADYPARLWLGAKNRATNASNSMGLPTQIAEPITVSDAGTRRLGHRKLAPLITG
jgi:hypothetical protein